MLIGCFCGIMISFATGSALLGVLAAVAGGALLGLLMGIFIVSFKADQIIVGIAVNMMGLGLSSYLMLAWFGIRGSFGPKGVVALPIFNPEWLERIPVIGGLLTGYSPLVYLSWALVAISYLVFYRSGFGLKLRSVGEFPEAAVAAGIRTAGVRYISLMIAGALAGLGAAQLTLGSLPIFSENMTAGRGFIAFSAAVFGANNPIGILIGSLVFGVAETLGIVLQSTGLPVHFMSMIPYVITIAVLSFAYRKGRIGGH